MPSTTTYKAGDVVVVLYQHTDGRGQGKRPAVVVSTEGHNRRALDVVLMPLTSRLHRAADPGAVVVEDWEAAGLLRPSIAKPALFSFPATDIYKHLGRVGKATRAKLSRALAEILGLRTS